MTDEEALNLRVSFSLYEKIQPSGRPLSSLNCRVSCDEYYGIHECNRVNPFAPFTLASVSFLRIFWISKIIQSKSIYCKQTYKHRSDNLTNTNKSIPTKKSCLEWQAYKRDGGKDAQRYANPYCLLLATRFASPLPVPATLSWFTRAPQMSCSC